MPTAFRELGGSPREWYDSAGFHARREFLIAWTDRDAFAVEILGESAELGGGGQVRYPGKADAYAVTVRYEPADPDQPDVKEMLAVDQDLNSYASSWAKAVVEYKTLVEEEAEPGTYLTYRTSHAGRYQQLGPGGWVWTDTSLPVPSTQELIKWIPTAEHFVTRHQVSDPPWAVIRSLQGKVNATAFLGCPAGTLLFEGATIGPIDEAVLDDEPASFCDEITFLFRERSIKSGGQVFGWNHAYRESPAGWMTVTNGTFPLHDSGDFGLLFE